MDTIATAPLRDLLTTLTSLTTLLSTSSSTASYSSLPTLISALIKADDDVTTHTLPALHQHQANYKRILALRARASLLRDEITSLVRAAAELRGEVASHVSDRGGGVGGEEDDDKAGKGHYAEVDYAALTSLAARIARFSDVDVDIEGPSSALARQDDGRHPPGKQKEEDEAQAQAQAQAEQDRQPQQGAISAITASKPNNKHDDNDADTDDDIAKQKAALDEMARAEHRLGGGRQGFAESAILRAGALGRLQMIREADNGITSASASASASGGGDSAVDAEVARLVRATENVAEEKIEAGGKRKEDYQMGGVLLFQGGDEEEEEKGSKLVAPPPPPVSRGGNQASIDHSITAVSSNNNSSSSSDRERVQEQQQVKKKTLSLDFEDISDDDDDDDDD